MNLKEFYDELTKHDWYYMMSDDHRAYMSGRQNAEKLALISKSTGQHKKLFDSFKNYYMSPATVKPTKPKLEDFYERN